MKDFYRTKDERINALLITVETGIRMINALDKQVAELKALQNEILDSYCDTGCDGCGTVSAEIYNKAKAYLKEKG